MLSHLKHNYHFYLLFLLFIGLARFDIHWQSLFLTEYYRLPFYTLAVISCLFVYTVCFKNASLCNTQSSNFRKLALVTVGYSGYEVLAFFIYRDPSKAQLLVYVALLLVAIIFFFHKDSRLNLDSQSDKYLQAVEAEKKFINIAIYPALLVIFALQNIYYLYVDFSFELYFNPFLQLALGVALANSCLILSKTRLDNFKNLLLVIETLLLILALSFFLYLIIAKFDFLTDNSHISNREVLQYAISFILIALVNLVVAFSKEWKSLAGFILKLASVILYLNLFFISYRVLYY
ncbi:hypothetical protein CKF54_04900 [Psittacicella hinzii]|uniref:Uncharacterized protein n=1 Tax=Psittacicella hinzii TaxID=2028575 RepID=A0A3A1Y250_9GAMM|nr:hypothetical protein [Psittacicella hinzii]RIY32402.1 hypothetical protein CKF54_04900 [Psittacicella hinzii]